MGDNSDMEYFADEQLSLFSMELGINENSGIDYVELPFIAPNVISALGMKDPVTLSCIFRAAWGLVLRSYLETNEVCFGMFPVSADTRDTSQGNLDLERLHICRLSLLADLPVHGILEQARVECLNHSPNSKHQCDEKGNLNGSPLLNTLVLATNSYISLEELRQDQNLQKLDLSLHIAMPLGIIKLSLYYQMKKISRWQATNVINSYYEALQGILMNGSGNISDINIFGVYDQALLDTWRPVPLDPIVDCLHTRISRQARTQPHAAAVCSWEVEWSYEELDSLSTRVASQLSKYGVRPEVLVPLCFEKSAWTIVAMLAVMKAGGAFVALDPQQPPARLQAIVKQLASPVLLTSARQAHRVSELGFTTSTCMIVGDASTAVLDTADGDFECSTSTRCPAYVIFTSGSTGEPKGVVIEHEAICTSCAAQSRAFSLQPSNRVLQFSSYAFDACIGEIFTTLFAGGCVCVPSDEERNNIAEVTKALRVNYVKLTPTLLGLIQTADLPGVQTIVSVGEKLTVHIRDKWAGHVKLINGYGPAECSVDASSAHVTLDSPADNIGYAMESCRLWVVDALDSTRLAPMGCAGELYIEGATLSRGYLNDQAKTQAAFQNNLPWIPYDSSGKRRRVYKTGDFVQYNADGTLKFLGRRDMQVKIHGQRIELGEIEHQVRVYLPAYQTIAVELGRFASHSEEHMLVAFLSEDSDNSSIIAQHEYDKLSLPMTDSLRMELTLAYSGLLEALPRHMVPSHFVSLRHMPLSSSGKLDRKVLRQIVSVVPIEEASLFTSEVAPQEFLHSDIEVSLQALWAKVLRLSPSLIGPDSNFFLLGGNSISVIRLLGAARDRHINVKAADIFRYPTLRSLAARASLSIPSISTAITEYSEEVLKLLQVSIPESSLFKAANVENIYQLTDVQKLLLFYNHLQQGSGFMRIEFAFDEAVDVNRVEAAFRSAVAEHQILRTVFVSNGDQLLQVLLRDCPINFRRLSHEAWSKDVQSNDCVARLEHFGAPIVHFVTLESNSKPTRHMMQFSHVQYDAFSIPLLVKSIHSFYEGTVCQATPKFSEFVAATHMDLGPSELYWRGVLVGSKLTELKLQPCAQYSFSQYSFKFQLIPFVSMNEYGVKTPSIIKAAWFVVLTHLTGQEDVVFGEVIAGRNTPLQGVDGLIGPCFDIIPIRVHSKPRTCLDLLQEIEKQHISGIPHEKLGILAIIERCTTWPKWSRLSSAVNYRTSIDSTPRKLSFGGLTAKISVTEKLANFADIVLDTAAGKDGIYINLAYEHEVLLSADAERLLAYFCDTVEFLVKSPNESLSSWRRLDPGVKVFSPPISEPIKPAISDVDLESSDGGACVGLVARIWKRLHLSHSQAADPEHPFYETRNHFETALILRDSYHQIGADLTLEDIMDHPTFGEHVLLVGRGRMSTRSKEKLAFGGGLEVSVNPSDLVEYGTNRGG